jgi:hypothetical protein
MVFSSSSVLVHLCSIFQGTDLQLAYLSLSTTLVKLLVDDLVGVFSE